MQSVVDKVGTFLFTKYQAEKYIQYENFLVINGFLRIHGCYNDIYIDTDDLVKIIELYMSKLYLVHLKPNIPVLTDHDKQRHDKFISNIDQISQNTSDIGFIVFFPSKKILKCQVVLYNEQLESVFVVSDVKTDCNGVFGTLSIHCNRLIDISKPNVNINNDHTSFNVTTVIANDNMSDCKSNNDFETKDDHDTNINYNYTGEFVEYFALSSQCLEKKMIILDQLRYSKHDARCGFGSVLSYYINIKMIKNYCKNSKYFNKIGIFGMNINILDLIIKKGGHRMSVMIDIIDKCIINSYFYQSKYLGTNNDTFWKKFQEYYILHNKQIDLDNDSQIAKDIKEMMHGDDRMNVSKYAAMCAVDTQFQPYLMGYDNISDTEKCTSDEIEDILKAEQVVFNGHATLGNSILMSKLKDNSNCKENRCQNFTMHVCSNENKALFRICDDKQDFQRCPPLKLKNEFEYLIFLEYNECTCPNMLDFVTNSSDQDCGHFISVEFF